MRGTASGTVASALSSQTDLVLTNGRGSPNTLMTSGKPSGRGGSVIGASFPVMADIPSVELLARLEQCPTLDVLQSRQLSAFEAWGGLQARDSTMRVEMLSRASAAGIPAGS